MKRALSIVVVVCMILAVLAGCTQNDVPAQTQTEDPAPAETKQQEQQEEQKPEDTMNAEPIKIGYFGPLTGGTAQAGQAMRNGGLIAIDEINAAGGVLGRPLELIQYDDKSSAEEAVKAATKLVEVDKVTAILGSLHSGNVLAAGPILEEYQTPTVGVGTSPTWLQQGYTYLFRSISNSQVAGKTLAAFANSRGYLNIASLHSNDEYGNTGSADFLKAIEVYGGKYVADESFTHGDRDFTGQMAKIIKSKPDAVLIWCLGDDLGPVTKQLRQAGYTGKVLGCEGYTLPEAIEISGSASNDCYFAAQYLVYDKPEDAEDSLMQSFLTKYMASFGEKPASDNAFRAYDAIKIIAKGIETAGSVEGPAIRQAINDIDGFVGLAGEFSFKGKQGEGIEKVRIFKIKDGKYYEAK